MPVFLVAWELEGSIPVEAATAAEALSLAKREWREDVSMASSSEAYFSPPREIKCLEEAYFEDSTLRECEGDCCVAGSDKSLKEILPSDPNYTNATLDLLMKAKKAVGE